MKHETMLEILDNVIKGIPNSCLSEHIKYLTELRNALASDTRPSAGAPAASPQPSPLKSFYVTLTLSAKVKAESGDDACNKAEMLIENRKGMDIIGYDAYEIEREQEYT